MSEIPSTDPTAIFKIWASSNKGFSWRIAGAANSADPLITLDLVPRRDAAYRTGVTEVSGYASDMAFIYESQWDGTRKYCLYCASATALLSVSYYLRPSDVRHILKCMLQMCPKVKLSALSVLRPKEDAEFPGIISSFP